MDLASLTTEQRNRTSLELDKMSTKEIVKVMNEADKEVAFAVEKEMTAITEAIEIVYERLKSGGRLFYIGAGTSGRLGVMDASECPPTFMTDKEMVQTIMAGGEHSFFEAIEGAEDDEEQGEKDLISRNVTSEDVVLGISSSGRTPYPIGALKYAKRNGIAAISLASNPDSDISQYADCSIEVITGPEILTGSTRLKAGTSHKMVLNIISTAVMVKLGKVYENLMVDVHASNYKLVERAKRTVIDITDTTYETAAETLKASDNQVKPAIIMIKTGSTYEQAKQALENHQGYVREAIKEIEGSENKEK